MIVRFVLVLLFLGAAGCTECASAGILFTFRNSSGKDAHLFSGIQGNDVGGLTGAECTKADGPFRYVNNEMREDFREELICGQTSSRVAEVLAGTAGGGNCTRWRDVLTLGRNDRFRVDAVWDGQLKVNVVRN